MPEVKIIHGDCIVEMAKLEANSFDAIVTDPPAGIAFMNKSWDSDKGGRHQWIAWMTQVMTECHRVLKPGGHAVIWAMPRTSHWTGMAIEDAGFEVRDCITHLFGSGFPKSLDVSKAIDKANGIEREDKFEGSFERRSGPTGNKRCDECGKWLVSGSPCQCPRPQDDPQSDTAKEWQGWGTALKPAAEFWFLARKPLSESTVVANVLGHGTGAINIDATRIGYEKGGDLASNPSLRTHINGGNGGNIISHEDERRIVIPNLAGRWPANVVLSHSEGCTQTGKRKVKARIINRWDDGSKPFGDGAGHPFTSNPTGDENGQETIEVWNCEPECAVRLLDEQSGALTSGAMQREVPGYESESVTGFLNGRSGPSNQIGDTGGASRFFYTAKAGGWEKSVGLEDMPITGNSIPQLRALKNKQCLECGCRSISAGTTELSCEHGNSNYEWTDGNDEGHKGNNSNNHPTVKSLDLMRWLVKLVTRPGGTVLDPFMGSGSTGCAAVIEGMNFVGIEQDAGHVEISKKRIEYWKRYPAPYVTNPALEKFVRPNEIVSVGPSVRAKPADKNQLGLF